MGAIIALFGESGTLSKPLKKGCKAIDKTELAIFAQTKVSF